MMKASFMSYRQRFEGMARDVREVAHTHLLRGEEAAAGILFVTAARLDSLFGQWANIVEMVIEDPGDDEPAPAVVEIKARHRHDFVESVAKGDDPPRCACGHVKRPNGRPRTQQVIAPAQKGPVFP